MKVWFPTLRCGTGTDIFTERLAAGLRSRGIEAVITWFHRNYEFCPELLMKHSAPANTDIIHGNSWSAFAFKKRGVPLVTTEHLAVLDPKFLPWKTIAQRLYHKYHIKNSIYKSYQASDRLVAVSHFTKEGMLRSGCQQNITVIHNGIDCDFFKPPDQTNSYIHRHPIKLLYAGNLSNRKGADLLPHLMNHLGNRAELWYTTGLRQSQICLPTKNCHCIGKLDTDGMRRHLQNSDALLFPSRFEGLPLVALESMACATPVIGFKGHSLDELLIHNRHGLLVPTDDVEALGSACLKLADDHRLIIEMGQAARNHVTNHFALTQMINAYIDLYTTL